MKIRAVDLLGGVAAAIAMAAGFSATVLILEHGWSLPELWLIAIVAAGVVLFMIRNAKRAGSMGLLFATALVIVFAAECFLPPHRQFGTVRANVMAAEMDMRAINADALRSGRLPSDPFSAARAALRSRRAGDTWIVWSVGPDGLDDNAAIAVPLERIEHTTESTVLLRIPAIRKRYWQTAARGDLVWRARIANDRVEVSQ